MTLPWENYLGFSMWTQCHSMSPYKWKEKGSNSEKGYRDRSNVRVMFFEEEWDHVPWEYRLLLETGENKETIFPLHLQKNKVLPYVSFRTLNMQNYKVIKFVLF